MGVKRVKRVSVPSTRTDVETVARARQYIQWIKRQRVLSERRNQRPGAGTSVTPEELT
jgi:hypothetical protein